MRDHNVQTATTVFEDIAPDIHYGKRRHVRYSADTSVLFIAPTQKYGEKPSQKDFFPVRCKDLSRGGFAFFLHEAPDFATLVVQLGSQRSPIYMEAEIVHFSQTERIANKSAWDILGREYASHFDGSAFQIGCQFIKRVATPP